MATDFLGYNIDVQSFLGVSYWTILFFMLVIFGALGIFLLWRFLDYNKFVLVKKIVANGQKRIIRDKYKIFKDKDGVIRAQFRSLKIKTTVPPPEAIEIDTKGKEQAMCYLFDTGEIQWITDSNTNESIKEAFKKNEVKLEPFTTNQRQMLQHEFYKAHLERGFKFSDHILTFVAVGAVVILIICLMVFYADIAKPVLEMGDKVITFQKEQSKMMENTNQILEKANQMVERSCAINGLPMTIKPNNLTKPMGVLPN